MNKLKKTLALLLSLVMILSLLPAMALADDAELPEEVSEVMKEEAQADSDAVAKIGDTEYATLAAAIADVPTDGTEPTTITLLKDVSVKYILLSGRRNIRLDLAGFTITLTGGGNVKANATTMEYDSDGTFTLSGSFFIFGGSILTITGNGTIVGSDPYYSAITNVGSLIIENGTFSRSSGYAPVLENNYNGTVTINGGTISSSANDHTIYNNAGRASSGVMSHPNSKLIINGGEILANAERKNAVDNFAIVEVNDGTITGGPVTSGTIPNAAINTHAAAAQVTINGGTINAGTPGSNYSECFSESSGTISINGGTYNKNISSLNGNGHVTIIGEVIDNNNGTWTVQPAVTYVAQIGTTGYATLEAAFAAATDGDTITLLNNCTGDGIKVPQGKFNNNGLTVDFGGFTYTVNANTVGSTGTETNGFQLLKGNKITFQNGTIYSEKAKILVQNYSDLTLDGMTLTLNNTSYTGAYTLSNNNGNVVIDKTTINANPAGGFAFDVCRYSSYTSVNVTVTGNSVINGDVEIYASKGDAKDGFSLTLTSGTMTGDIVVDSTAAAAMKAAPEKVSVTKADGFDQAAPAGYKWDESGKLVAVTAQIGDDKYETLAAAIAAVSDNTETTITMIGDETIVGNAGVTVAKNQKIVLDLNGHTIQNAVNENKGSQVITNYGNLTIQDTSANADGCIQNSASEEMAVGSWPTNNYVTNVITNSGTLTVKSGTIRQTARGSICYAVDNNSTSYDTTLNMEGGLLTDDSGTVVRMFCNSTTKENIVNVSGGEISTPGYAAIWTQLPGSNSSSMKKATLNISGGTISGGTYAWYDYTYGDGWDNVSYNFSGGQLGGYIYSYGRTKFVTGGIYANKPSAGYIADGYVAVANTDEETNEEYPWAVAKVPVTVEETTTTGTTEEATAEIKQGDDVQATVTVTVADVATVQAVDGAVAASVPNVSTSLNVAKVVEKAAEETELSGETNTIKILVKAEAAETAPTGVTVPENAAVIKVDPYAIVNNDTAHPIALTNEDLGSNPSFTFQVALGQAFASKVVTLKHYSDEGELKNTFNNVLTDASGNATVTLTSFSYLIGEVAYQVSDATGNYLQTTNADIRSSLLWNVYFHIEASSIADPVNNAYILVNSRYDEEIDGQTYRLTFDSERSAYKITVPIRPRLIDQEVGFTLISGDTVYPISLGSSGTAYEKAEYNFNEYLTLIQNGADADVVTGLRVWRDVLTHHWPVVAKY